MLEDGNRMVRYSLKQMLRSPLKTGVFFLLLVMTACLLFLGVNLWEMNQKAMKEFEDFFITIGTVQQKKSDSELKVVWDELTGKNIYYQKKKYDKWIQDDELVFDEAKYLAEPIQRPYFGADMEHLSDFPSFDGNMEEDYFTAEFILKENYDGSKPVKLKIVKSLADSFKEGDEISFFHYEDICLQTEKRYIASFARYTDVDGNGEYEFCLGPGLSSTQYNKEGQMIKGNYEHISISEVTEGFYETELGKCWLEQGNAVQKYQDILPVTPVLDTDLIMAFYEQRAMIKEGREISKEEYQRGDKVCLVSRFLADRLGLKVGGQLRLPLLYASYGETPAINFGTKGGGFAFTLLNAEGELYEVFDDQTYEVVGIYDIVSNLNGEHALSPVEVFVPYHAVKGEWDNNIVSTGPMTAGNTSFKIENGTIEEFLELWNQQEFADSLEVIFYDKGYSKFEESIQSRKIMSCIFLVSGLLLSIVIMVFFCNIFINGQKQRITIERVLGLSKKECRISTLSGLFLVTAIGSIAGSALGWVLTKHISMQFVDNVSYDSLYSITRVYSEEMNHYQSMNSSLLQGAVTVGVLIAFSALVSSIYMKKILDHEPLSMLGKIED